MRHAQRFSYGRFIALLAAAALVAGCGEGFIPEPAYQATAIPEDVTELFELSGNADSDTVWVLEQGGPAHMLDTPENVSHVFRNYSDYEDVQLALVHQTLTLNQDLAPRNAEFSLAELQAEVDVSVEILHRTIGHFRDQGKRVVVIGHSYGAFLMARYLSHHGPDAAHRYLIMAGRLDMPEEVVNAFLAGTLYYFPDGVTPTAVPPFPVPPTDQELMERRIAAATGHDRYTERLADTDLRRVIYVYGTLDELVGRLTDEEVGFLESRGATVIAIQDGDHTSMFENEDAAEKSPTPCANNPADASMPPRERAAARSGQRYRMLDGIPVWGDPEAAAVEQMRRCAHRAERTALMADHHLGYAVPIGGVVAYADRISPSGAGFDIGCGNKAVLLDADAAEIRRNIRLIMDDLWRTLSFGIGRKNPEPVDHELFDDAPAWDLPAAAALRDLARSQLGTIGSGNHFVDLFADERGRAWVGVHFGSRGLGHKLATHFIKAGGGTDGMNVDPVVLDADSDLGREYLACMHLAGRYAYAGRDWVCARVARLLGARIVEEVHNHHNFAWRERHFGQDLWVVRKGATPAFPGQRGFVGGTMGDISVIIEGLDGPESELALRSTIHGAGRVMSRTQAAGKSRFKRGRRIQLTEGRISRKMMQKWLDRRGVELRGAGTDESPHCYKRIEEVLRYHDGTIRVVHVLEPIGVAMASADEIDPFRD